MSYFCNLFYIQILARSDTLNHYHAEREDEVICHCHVYQWRQMLSDDTVSHRLTHHDNRSLGYGATAHLESGGFIRSRPHVAHPDIQFHFLPSQVIDHGRVASKIEAYQVCVLSAYGSFQGGIVQGYVCVFVICKQCFRLHSQELLHTVQPHNRMTNQIKPSHNSYDTKESVYSFMCRLIPQKTTIKRPELSRTFPRGESLTLIVGSFPEKDTLQERVKRSCKQSVKLSF